ncbi:MAG: trimeric intracellular cation channel family protein [Actinomycetota bacterium]|nr:trimeric intracellular cation channel family protein [Actinomycetota bacterium]
MFESLFATASVAASAAAAVAPSVEATGLASIITTVVPSVIASALPSALTTTTPVTAMIVRVPVAYELTAAFVGGLSGAVHADERRMDLTGILILAIVNALGGGMLRDVLLQNHGIAAFLHPRLLGVALLAAAFGFFFTSAYRSMHRPFLYLDAVSLGLFAVVGADKALSAGLTVIPAVLLGVITSVGGGMIRDVLCSETPQVMRPGTLSATAAILGSSLYVFLVSWMNIVKPVALIVTVAVTVTIRLLAIKRGWQAPMAVHLKPTSGRGWRFVRKEEPCAESAPAGGDAQQDPEQPNDGEPTPPA